MAGCTRGMLRGFPVVNLAVQLREWHVEGEKDESAMALRVCGEKVVRAFCDQQSLVILEPSMAVEFRAEGKRNCDNSITPPSHART